MKLGILGAGSIGARHVRAFREAGATVSAVASRDLAGARRFAEAQGDMLAVASVSELIAQVDAVCICTPTDLHLAQALACFEAGKPVLCEKPLGRSSAEAMHMRDAAQKAGCALHPMHVLRWFAPYADARDRAMHGEFGLLETVSLERHGTRPSAPGGSWFEDETRSGGVLLDLMIHDFDYALWLCGPAKSVRAQYIDPLTVQAVIQHHSGTLTHVDGSWTAPRFRTAASLFGLKEMHMFDSTQPDPVDPYLAQARELLAALTGHGAVRVNADDAIAALRLAEAAAGSAKQLGQPVNVS